MNTDGMTDEEKSAQFVIHSLNCHDELVAALESLLTAHDSYPAIQSLPELPHWTQARTALAAARLGLTQPEFGASSIIVNVKLP